MESTLWRLRERERVAYIVLVFALGEVLVKWTLCNEHSLMWVLFGERLIIEESLMSRSNVKQNSRKLILAYAKLIAHQ